MFPVAPSGRRPAGRVLGPVDELIAEHLRERVAHSGLSDEARAAGAEELVAVIRRCAR